MPGVDQDIREALIAVRHATLLLERASAPVVAGDATAPLPGGAQSSTGSPVPLSLMRMALALMDRNGDGSSTAACFLQSAIDHSGPPLPAPR